MNAYDIILVGAGPAGLAAAASFKRAGKRYLHLEKGSVSQTIRLFAKGIKLYSPRKLLQFGGVPFLGDPDAPPYAEEYAGYLQQASRRLGLRVQTQREITSVASLREGYLLTVRGKTGQTKECATRNLVVATGGYYAPVPLGIPGEWLPLVSHYFRGETPARGQRVLVVGGRNSAVEACNILARKGAQVTLSYRRSRLPRKQIKPWLLPEFDQWVEKGRVRKLFNTLPGSVNGNQVCLEGNSAIEVCIECDRVYLLTGYGPDYTLLKMANVPFHKRTRRPLFNPATLETKLPGIFLCGTIVLKWNGKQANIENTRDHGQLILQNLR